MVNTSCPAVSTSVEHYYGANDLNIINGNNSIGILDRTFYGDMRGYFEKLRKFVSEMIGADVSNFCGLERVYENITRQVP